MRPAPTPGGHAKAVTQLPEEGRVMLPAGQVPPGTTQIQNHQGDSAPTRPAKPRMTFLLPGALRVGEPLGAAQARGRPHTPVRGSKRQASKPRPRCSCPGFPSAAWWWEAEHQASPPLAGRAQDLHPQLRPEHLGNTQEAGHLLQPPAGKVAPHGPCDTQQAPRLLSPTTRAQAPG